MFLPKEGQDFNYLNFVNRAELAKLPDDKAQFYKSGEPEGYRKKATNNERKNGRTA